MVSRDRFYEVVIEAVEGVILRVPIQRVQRLRDRHTYRSPIFTMVLGFIVYLVLVIIGNVPMTQLSNWA